MSRFVVIITEHTSYTVPVEAGCAKEAIPLAFKKFLAEQSPVEAFDGQVEDRVAACAYPEDDKLAS